MADRHVVYKNGAKEIASQFGRAITFMAKYRAGEVGSSCHVHSSVWDRDASVSLMWDENAPDHLSPVFRGWLAGQIACGQELAWMYAPTVNSYKRYQAESWAPTALAWSVDNRTCGFRIIGHGPSFRLESRIPGADVNPYLAYAATIAAGLHGIQHGLEPPTRFNGNAYAAAELPPRAVEPRRGDRRVRELEGGDRRVRRRRARASPQHGSAGVGALQPSRHRLGTATELRPVVNP